MNQDQPRNQPQNSAYHDGYHLLFEGADMVSSFWQPVLKSVGRWHLEVAGLGIKHTQASFRLTQDLSRCWTANDVAAAHLRYWDQITSTYAQSSQRLAATVTRSVDAPLIPSIVTLTVKPRSHDLIELPNTDASDAAEQTRKVA